MIIPAPVLPAAMLVITTSFGVPSSTPLPLNMSTTSSVSPHPTTPSIIRKNTSQMVVVVGLLFGAVVWIPLLLAICCIVWAIFWGLCKLIAGVILFLYEILGRVWKGLSQAIHRRCTRARPRPMTQTSPPQLPIPRIPLPQLPPPILLSSSSFHRAKSSDSTSPPSSTLDRPTPLISTPGSKSEGSECPICYEEMDDHRPPTVGAPCGHILCQPCRGRVIAYSSENGITPACHICRFSYDSSTGAAPVPEQSSRLAVAGARVT